MPHTSEPSYLTDPRYATEWYLPPTLVCNYYHRYCHVTTGNRLERHTPIRRTREWSVTALGYRMRVRTVGYEHLLTESQIAAVHDLLVRHPVIAHWENDGWRYHRDQVESSRRQVCAGIDAIFNSVPEILQEELAQEERDLTRARKRAGKLFAKYGAALSPEWLRYVPQPRVDGGSVAAG